MKGQAKHHKYKRKLDREVKTRSTEDAARSFHFREAAKDGALMSVLEEIDEVGVEENLACGSHAGLWSNGSSALKQFTPLPTIFE